MNELTATPANGQSLALSLAAETSRMLDMIERAATNPDVDVAKMGALMDLQDRMYARQSEALFNEAMGNLQLELPRIKKRKGVSYDKGKSDAFTYAPWEEIDAVIRPLMIKHGFYPLNFDSTPREGGGMTVTAFLRHSGGHVRSASIPLGIDNGGGKNSVQGMGSTFTYGQRYTAKALLNLVFEGEDDDGVEGGKRYITADQKAELVALQAETKADTAMFLRHYGVASLDEMEAKQFIGARNALLAKKQKLQGGAQ